MCVGTRVCCVFSSAVFAIGCCAFGDESAFFGDLCAYIIIARVRPASGAEQRATCKVLAFLACVCLCTRVRVFML